MKADKQLWVLAGGNGAGKSTFYRTRLACKGIPFVNADVLARQLFPDEPEQQSYAAAMVAAQMRSRLLQQGRTFCYETVFSHPSKVDFVAQAKTLGYEIVLVFIHLADAALNQARIVQRISEGGHSVPPDKVASRIPRTLRHIQQVLPLCDVVYILDNSRADNPFQQVAVVRDGLVQTKIHPMPIWAQALLAGC